MTEMIEKLKIEEQTHKNMQKVSQRANNFLNFHQIYKIISRKLKDYQNNLQVVQ